MNDPRRTARWAGALWLVVIAVSVLAVATQSALPRLAFAANQFGGLVYLGVTVLFYQLFKPVDPAISLFAAFWVWPVSPVARRSRWFGPIRRLKASTSRWSFSARRSSRSDI